LQGRASSILVWATGFLLPFGPRRGQGGNSQGHGGLLIQLVAHHRLPYSQTMDVTMVVSVYAFFHSAEKGRGSDHESSAKSSTDQKQTQKYLLKSCASGKEISPRLVPVSSSGLLKAERPSRMPTRERSAPTSAWPCRHCPQDCAPAALATLWTMPPPPVETRRRTSAAYSGIHTLGLRCDHS
jgi:hypothetical protein